MSIAISSTGPITILSQRLQQQQQPLNVFFFTSGEDDILQEEGVRMVFTSPCGNYVRAFVALEHKAPEQRQHFHPVAIMYDVDGTFTRKDAIDILWKFHGEIQHMFMSMVHDNTKQTDPDKYRTWQRYEEECSNCLFFWGAVKNNSKNPNHGFQTFQPSNSQHQQWLEQARELCSNIHPSMPTSSKE